MSSESVARERGSSLSVRIKVSYTENNVRLLVVKVATLLK